MQLLGFLRNVRRDDGTKQLAVMVDWNKVDVHMAKVRKSTRIQLDPDCLRWIPLLTQLPTAYQSPDDTNDTGSEACPSITDQSCALVNKPVAAMAEKVQRIKIRKKISRGRKIGGIHRKGGFLKKRIPPQKPKLMKIHKEAEKSLGHLADTEDNLKDHSLTETKNPLVTPKAAKTAPVNLPKISTQLSESSTKTPAAVNSSAAEFSTPLLSSPSQSRRSVRTAEKKEAAAAAAAAAGTPTSTVEQTVTSPPPSRKRKHSETVESEDKEEKLEGTGRKRTRESQKDKEKEKEIKKDKVKEKDSKDKGKNLEKDKVKESARLKEREAAKESPSLKVQRSSKESTPTTPKNKRQSKLDDILKKVNNSKVLQARQAREKRAAAAAAAAAATQNTSTDETPCDKKETEDVKESITSPRRGRPKTSTKDLETKTSVVEDSGKDAKALKKQLTIPDMFSTTTPMSTDSSDQQLESKASYASKEKPAVSSAAASSTEVSGASPGEYEGGDEDDGDEEEFVPRSKVTSVIQSLDTASDATEINSANEKESSTSEKKDTCSDVEMTVASESKSEKSARINDSDNKVHEETYYTPEQTRLDEPMEEEPISSTIYSNTKTSDVLSANSMQVDDPKVHHSETKAVSESSVNTKLPMEMKMDTVPAAADKREKSHASLISSHAGSVVDAPGSQPMIKPLEKVVTAQVSEHRQSHHHHHHHDMSQVLSQPEEKLHSPESGKFKNIYCYYKVQFLNYFRELNVA